MSALPSISDINLFRNRKSIIYFDAQISDGTFDPFVTEQQLHSAKVAGSAVDQTCLGSAKGMGPEYLGVETNPAEPFRDKSGVLARGHTSTQPAAREKIITRLLACATNVLVNRLACLLRQFEPYGLPGLLLPDCHAVQRP